jgi:parallel beta-helix repeat protein
MLLSGIHSVFYNDPNRERRIRKVTTMGMRRERIKIILASIFCCFPYLWVSSSQAATLSVPGNYSTIQAAVDAAGNGDIINVAAGTYTEPITISKKITLTGAGPGSTFIIGASTNTITLNTGAELAQISGFRIIGASNAGVYCQNAGHPSITNNLISGNFYGIYITSGYPSVTSNTISGNSTGIRYQTSGTFSITANIISGNSGDGIYCLSGSPNISYNSISGNNYGINCSTSGSPNITYNSISGNSYGIYSYGLPTITNNTISGNSSGNIDATGSGNPTITYNIISGGGGGISSSSPATITNNIISGSISCSSSGFSTITCNTISGGGISCTGGTSTVINNVISGSDSHGISLTKAGSTITNNTISGNASYGINCSDSSPTITNNIISGNNNGGIYCNTNSTPTINYNAVWGNTTNYSGCGAGANDISQDPKFISSTDFHLQLISPCIDKGSNTASGIPTTDKDGNPRILDGDGNGTSTVDMGAYEFILPFHVSILSPQYALANGNVTLSVKGQSLLGTSAIKLVNSKTSQAMAGSSLSVSTNNLSAQFSLSGAPGLFNLVLTKAGVDYVFKTLFTLLTPEASPVLWQMHRLAKAGNPGAAGSLVIADVDRNNEAEIFAASGGQNVARLKKSGANWPVATFLDTPGETFQQLLAVDGNGDGELELYAVGGLPQFYQYSWGKPTPTSALGPDGGPMAAGDGNHDGALEIYATSGKTATGQGLDEWYYTGGIWFSHPVKTITTGVVFTSLAVGDADHDPNHGDEIYAAYRDASNNDYLYQYQYNGSSWNATVITNPGTGEIKSLVIADLDRNGQNELYVASADGKIYQLVYMNPGWSSTPVNSSNSVVCNQITVGDGDNDGQDELYAAGADGHAWQFKYHGGSWQAIDLGGAGTALNAITVGDGDNNFQCEIYALGADGYVYQYQLETAATPTPTITATTTSTPTATVTPTPAAIATAIPPTPTVTATPLPPQNYFKIFHSQINPNHGELARIKWTQSQPGPVTIMIFNLLGDKIITLSDHETFSGIQYNELQWDGRTSQGRVAGSGIYIVILQAPEHQEKGKIAVVK